MAKINIKDLCGSAKFMVNYKRGFISQKALVVIWFTPKKIHVIDNENNVELGFKLGDLYSDALHWVEDNGHTLIEINNRWNTNF